MVWIFFPEIKTKSAVSFLVYTLLVYVIFLFKGKLRDFLTWVLYKFFWGSKFLLGTKTFKIDLVLS